MSFYNVIIFILFLIYSLNVFSQETLNNKLYEKPYANNALKSGKYFAREETRNIELDEFENPGMIWVERGKDLFNLQEGANNSSCALCHKGDTNSLLGAAASYPKIYKNR